MWHRVIKNSFLFKRLATVNALRRFNHLSRRRSRRELPLRAFASAYVKEGHYLWYVTGI